MWQTAMNKGITEVVLIVLALLATLPAVSSASELDDIRQAIISKRARWVAGENSMTRLSPAERRKRLGNLSTSGALPPVTTADQTVTSQEPLTGTPPATLDWRANNGNFVTPVRDQGQCGSCWAFATAAAMESRFLINSNWPGVDLNLSEQVLVSCSGAGNCGGGYISYASNYLKDYGLPLETCYTYTATNGTCAGACSNWQPTGFRINTWQYITTSSANVTALKSALNTYGPLVTTMNVYSDFFAYRSGIYSRTSSTLEGGHAVLLIGYDDSSQCFIVKNSWGTGWGESGFFRISYSELGTATNFGLYTIAYSSAYTLDSTPPAGSVQINGITSITGSNAVSLFLSATDNANGIAQMCVSNTSTCSSWEKYVTSKAWSLPIGDGEKTLYVWFRDYAGNTSTSACSDSIILDTMPPVLSLSTLTGGITTSAQIMNVAGTVSDLTGIQNFTVNGTTVPFAAADGIFSYPVVLSAGANSVFTTARDQLGNTTTDSRSVTLDTEIPALSISSPADLSWTSGTFCSIAGTTDENTTVEISVNGGSPAAASMNGTVFSGAANLNTGLNTLIITSTNLTGKKNSLKRTIFLNSQKPDLAISEPGQDMKTCESGIRIRGSASYSSPVNITVEAGGQVYTPSLTNGLFEQLVPLPNAGTYPITVKAGYDSGNESTVLRNVIRVIPPDGDLNGDGKVTVADVILSLQIAIGKVAATNALLSHGDVAPLKNGVPDPDLKMTTADALVLLQKAVGLVNW